ncbi:MAG: FAD-dependent oxidoreductase [bacterium]|nr:FAD-dependent oxidoreductase [bacterium]
MNILIIGGGICGTTAAGELRKALPDASITIFEEEYHRLYSRVLLPHYLKGKVEREKVFLKSLEWYSEQNIELLTGVRAEGIDTKNQFVFANYGREYPYDKLLLATGHDVRLASEDARGVHYLRTLDDADGILARIKTLRADGEKTHAVVYGGGFIALEFLNAFHQFDLETTLLLRSRFFSQSLGENGHNLLLTHAENQGVKILTEVEDIELVKNGEDLTGIRAGGGTIPAKILGVGLGNHLDEAYYKVAGIDFGNGIIVNQKFETSAEHVYAAGDIVQYPDVLLGAHMRYGNYMNAMMHGRFVAKAIAGSAEEMSLVSSYATNLLGKEIVMVGDTRRSEVNEIEVVHEAEGELVEVFSRGGRAVGGIMIGYTKPRATITKAIKENIRYENPS